MLTVRRRRREREPGVVKVVEFVAIPDEGGENKVLIISCRLLDRPLGLEQTRGRAKEDELHLAFINHDLAPKQTGL